MPFDYRIVRFRDRKTIAILKTGQPTSINTFHAVSQSGQYYACDITGKIWKVNTDGSVIQIANIDEYADNVTPAFSGVLECDGIAVSKDGRIYSCNDTALVKLRENDGADLIAGHPRNVGLVAGGVKGPDARFRIIFVPKVSKSGNVYFSDTFAHKIMKVTPDGRAYTLAGGGATGSQSGFADGRGETVLFNNPWGLDVDDDEVVWVCDRNNGRIRRIDPDGNVITIAGGGTSSHLDGQGTAARFVQARFLILDPNGRFAYVIDRAATAERYISRVDESGNARTIGLITDSTVDLAITPSGDLTYLGITAV
jgi:sugar lactone lactonase YvrE